MSKTELKFRVEWYNDIPICKGVEPNYNWRNIPWKTLERRVYKLQKRIYRAAQRGEIKVVRKLQKIILHSWSAKCLAVRKVTQDNTGKKTAGVDGVKSLSPAARLALVGKLKLKSKAKPIRRVWIPKPGKDEKRPLGIATIDERAKQALVKLALEPEWEARFEENSYGFRAGRSAHDAIEAVFNAIRFKPKYVFDADIASCFDKINHCALLTKLNTFPTISRQIRAWLKAGVIDFKNYATRQKSYSATEQGVPQGGVISPLLANIALHGMEYRIKQAFPRKNVYKNGKYAGYIPNAILIRYADDFLIMHEDLNVIQKCQQIIVEWLSCLGLELKPSKTRISHTLNKYSENVGFDFLGFTIRHFPVGKCHTGKNTQGQLLGFKTIIKPSKEKLKVHIQRIGKVIKRHNCDKQLALIKHLNPIIRGWSNYYSTVCSSSTFSAIEHIVYRQLKSWSKHRHPHKPFKWIRRKYWQSNGGDNWVFQPLNDDRKLRKYTDTKIINHIKVQSNRSVYDGDWIYWSTRRGQHPEAPKDVSKLLKLQKGKCAHCGLYFYDGNLLEVDHIIPLSKGGLNNLDNKQLLHRHCHDVKTANDK
ncbi:MAG: group II intron reverse transcriptase/maturase [Richelia sp. SM1_7_0]|nr:group II intron reverse transcriptase/maturase [Richelia sp. SM1_7_0]